MGDILGIGEIGGEVVETTGEVMRQGIAAGTAIATKLLEPTKLQPQAPMAAMPTVAGTAEGTKQLRMILRQRTKEAKIQAKTQMITTAAASPMAVLMLGFGSMVALQGALLYIVANSNDPRMRDWAKEVYSKLPSLVMPVLPNGLTNITGLIPNVTGGGGSNPMGDLGYALNRPIMDAPGYVGGQLAWPLKMAGIL